VIGKEFNSDAKTVRVHGHVSGEKPPFIKDLFINAKIWLSDETATALPEKSIITDARTLKEKYDRQSRKTVSS